MKERKLKLFFMVRIGYTMITHTNVRHPTAKDVVSMSSEKKIYNLLRVLV